MNKVILMGRLTRDPNVRYTQQNSSQESMCVARYTLAVDRRGASDFFEKYNNIPEALKGIDTKDIVDAVIAELENRNNAAAEAEKQRIEAEKQQILDDLYLYGM